MRRAAAMFSLAMVLAAGLNAYAFDPERQDILRLQLGMTEARVTAILLRQGISADRIRRSESPCPHGWPDGRWPDGRPCAVTIVAPTPDGELTIILTVTGASASPTVHQITYVIMGHAINQADMVMDAVLGRFGQPDQAIPMTWCRAPTIRHTCAEAEAWLRFWPESQTITLRGAEPADDGGRQQP
jgi:hypothetical protein